MRLTNGSYEPFGTNPAKARSHRNDCTNTKPLLHGEAKCSVCHTYHGDQSFSMFSTIHADGLCGSMRFSGTRCNDVAPSYIFEFMVDHRTSYYSYLLVALFA